MPGGLTSGITSREFLRQSIMSTILRSHTVAMGGMVDSMGLRAMSAKLTQVSLYHPSGQQYIMCGETKAGDSHVAAR